MKPFFLSIIICFALFAKAQEYPKAILPGDYPDPTIVRDGKDYYMTHSPFYYIPGFLVWHSQDLMNWRPVCRIIPEFRGSAMAPDLIKHNGRFYLYYPAAGTNWVVWADDIKGPWSEPIDLKVRFIDPGHVVGEDGNRYLYLSEGMKVALSDDGLSTVGRPVKAYEGWEYPKNWVTEGMWLESPKFVKKDGYFYLISAQGGTAGPPTSHMVVAARSKSVDALLKTHPIIPSFVHTAPTTFGGQKVTVRNNFGKKFIVRILNQGNRCAFFAGKDRDSWILLAENIDVSFIHYNTYGRFYALRPALVSAGKGEARFKQFRYKNAVPQEKDMSAYLMVFHKDDTHGLHFALSADGYSFTALNDGKPVIAGDTIADQKGIRDPHIYRGPDGAFYITMTDLHISARRAVLRDTQWERDGDTFGWGNNRGLILMKSWDLVNWKRANIRFNELSAQFAEIGCAWAPQTIFDEVTGKLMIYFTMRYRNEANKLYYVYVNEAFDRLESMPRLLFEYSDEKVSAIDADITKIGDKYRMFYVSHDGPAGIKQAVSDKINSGYEYDPRWYDIEEKACEAPNVWKRIGEDKWVLMYDCYGQAIHNFGFIETSDFVNFQNLGQFNEGVMKTTNFTSPKHGAIIPVTRDEAERLTKYWTFK